MPCRSVGLVLCGLAIAGLSRDREAAAMTEEPVEVRSPADREPVARRHFEAAVARGMPREAVLLLVRVPAQTMDMVVNQTVITTFPVSTSRHGIGNRQHSYRTPLGLHEVVARIGADAPPGQVFRGRVPTHEVIPPDAWRGNAGEDLVLTRILWLRGREPGLNAGPGICSYERYIYIHGTNEEHRLGRPASNGCIRMANQTVIELFHAVANRPVWCWIINE